MKQKYFGSWSNHASMARDWFSGGWDYEKHEDRPPVVPADFPTDEEIIFASYGGCAYEGDAQVVFMRDGKLFEANGSHCSCYGLSECDYSGNERTSQWAPEETTFEALQLQARAGDGDGNPWQRGYKNCYRLRSNEHEDAAIDRFYELFGGETLNV